MKTKDDPQVSIAGIVTGTMIVMIAIVVLFARESAWVLAPIAGFMTLLGIMLGHFSRIKK